MFALINTATNEIFRNEDGTVRTWEKKNSAAKFNSSKKLGLTVSTYEPAPTVAEELGDSLSARLRARAAEFTKESRDDYMAEALDHGANRSMARRQWRKVHGSMYAK